MKNTKITIIIIKFTTKYSNRLIFTLNVFIVILDLFWIDTTNVSSCREISFSQLETEITMKNTKITIIIIIFAIKHSYKLIITLNLFIVLDLCYNRTLLDKFGKCFCMS